MTLRPLVVALAAGVVASTACGTAAAAAQPPATEHAGSSSTADAGKIRFGEPTFFRMKRPGGLQGVGDFDQDGNPDLVSIGTEEDHQPLGRGYITVFAGDGAGDFERAATARPDGPPGVVRVGDMNNDGDPDLVITSSYREPDHTISVYLGLPGLEFADPITEGIKARVWDFELGDLDDDGDLDVVTNSYNAHHGLLAAAEATSGGDTENRELTAEVINLMENVGDGQLEKRPGLPYNTTEVELGDVNEDGRLDIVAFKLGGVVVARNNGAWSFTLPTTFPFMGKFPSNFRLRDLDADGHLDLCSAADDGTSIRYGLGDGTFETRTTLPERNFAEAADIDGDGPLDLVFNGSGVAPVAVAETGRSYADPVLVETVPDAYGVSMVADVNTDGRPDFVLTAGEPHRGATLLNKSTD